MAHIVASSRRLPPLGAVDTIQLAGSDGFHAGWEQRQRLGYERHVERPYFIIDAFTNERFAGNAAGVVMGAEGLSDREMLGIAAEFNLSETTFVLPPASFDSMFRFRWFTPTVEVAMCGHATIAGLRALVETGRIKHENPLDSTPVVIDTLAGKLAASVESMPGNDSSLMFWLDLPPPSLMDEELDRAKLAGMLGLGVDAFEPSLPISKTQDNDLLVFVKDFLALNEARPDFVKLAAWQQRRASRGLCLATVKTLSPSIHLQSRFFAPTLGIDEDPVTGSVHGPLVAYLLKHNLVPVVGGLAGLTCTQAKAGGRAGLIHALAGRNEDGSYWVRIAGQAVITMRGMVL